MSNTSLHVVAACGWLVGFPLLVAQLFASGALPSAPLQSMLVSLVWGLGLVVLFGSWALRDAPAHGKSRNLALGFTAGWFFVFALAVIPYLFVTRGLKGGTVAALKFVSLCVGLAIAWLVVPRLFSGLF